MPRRSSLWTKLTDGVCSICAPDIGLRKWVETTADPVAQRRYHYHERVESKYDVTDAVAGVGMSGEVRIVKGKAGDSKAGKTFVLKTLPIAEEKTWAMLRNEVQILLTLDHPHVARLEDAFQANNKICLVMEYCAGKDVFDRIVELGHYTERQAAATVKQMLQALNYLHVRENPIVHRDLKPENFLYDIPDTDDRLKPCVKLIDFGISMSLDHLNGKKFKFAGTKIYAPPEANTRVYTEKVDVWSLGVTVYTMLTGLPMFDETKIGRFARGFTWEAALDTAFAIAEFTKLSVEAQSFIRNLVCVDLDSRLSAAAALEHRWIIGNGQDSAEGGKLPVNILKSVTHFSKASHFRKACLHMMAWELNAQDCEEMRLTFESLDTDHSGMISIKEFRDALLENFDLNNAEVDRYFQGVDDDDNQALCYTEFLAAAMQDRVRMHNETVRAAFSRFDVGNKGYITAKDFETNLGPLWDGVNTAVIFNEADPDGTGKISCDRFMQYMNGGGDHSIDDDDDSEEVFLTRQKQNELWARWKQKGEIADLLMSDTVVTSKSMSRKTKKSVIARKTEFKGVRYRVCSQSW